MSVQCSKVCQSDLVLYFQIVSVMNKIKKTDFMNADFDCKVRDLCMMLRYIRTVFSRESDSTFTNVRPFVRSSVRPSGSKTPQQLKSFIFHHTTFIFHHSSIILHSSFIILHSSFLHFATFKLFSLFNRSFTYLSLYCQYSDVS